MLSERILLGEFGPGVLVVADVAEDGESVVFRAVEAPTAPDVPPVELAGGGEAPSTADAD